MEKIKSTRRGYIVYYVLGIIMLFSFILLLPYFSWKNITSNLLYYFGFFGFLILIVGLFEYPEWQIIMTSYEIDSKGLTKIEGIVRKKRTSIPYSKISSIEMSKGILGRLLGFGNVRISSFGKGEIVFEKIRNPERIYKKIKSKIPKEKD